MTEAEQIVANAINRDKLRAEAERAALLEKLVVSIAGGMAHRMAEYRVFNLEEFGDEVWRRARAVLDAKDRQGT